ncbi:hypothetical protein KVT40_000343 [Elsinoe batatas]|uniref:Uncharacterized protein n=1 Tax=Elsinoe batatas TaxID=2601811 RepID=A0A8K0LAS2_9PEZI|nr:hypothetical protein KVT40_000343 [Elsinoe batatas]
MRVRKHFHLSIAGLQYLRRLPRSRHRHSVQGVLHGETGTTTDSDEITDFEWQRRFDLAKEHHPQVQDYLQQVKLLEHQAQDIAQQEGPVADLSTIETSLRSLWTRIEVAVSEKSTGEALSNQQLTTEHSPKSPAQAGRDFISDSVGLEQGSGEKQLRTTYTTTISLLQRLLSSPKDRSRRFSAWTRVVQTHQQSSVYQVLRVLHSALKEERQNHDWGKSGPSEIERSVLVGLRQKLKRLRIELLDRANSLGQSVHHGPDLKQGIYALLADRTVLYRLADTFQAVRQKELASASKHKWPRAKQTSAPVTRQRVVADRNRASAARYPGDSALDTDKSLNYAGPHNQAEEEVNDFANLPGDLSVVDDSSSAARSTPKSVTLTNAKSESQLNSSLTLALVDKFRREVRERAHQQTLGGPKYRNQSLAAELSSSRDSGVSRNKAGEVESSTTASPPRNTTSTKSIQDIPAEDLVRRLMSGASRLHTPAE